MPQQMYLKNKEFLFAVFYDEKAKKLNQYRLIYSFSAIELILSLE